MCPGLLVDEVTHSQTWEVQKAVAASTTHVRRAVDGLQLSVWNAKCGIFIVGNLTLDEYIVVFSVCL